MGFSRFSKARQDNMHFYIPFKKYLFNCKWKIILNKSYTRPQVGCNGYQNGFVTTTVELLNAAERTAICCSVMFVCLANAAYEWWERNATFQVKIRCCSSSKAQNEGTHIILQFVRLQKKKKLKKNWTEMRSTFPNARHKLKQFVDWGQVF